MLSLLGRFWCRLFHRKVSYGGGSHYVCARCRRIYQVPWGVQ